MRILKKLVFNKFSVLWSILILVTLAFPQFLLAQSEPVPSEPPEIPRPPDFEAHSCKNFCTGTPYDTCADDTELDCSIPFNPDDLFTPKQDLETGVYERIIDYLGEYLKSTIPANGIQYSYHAQGLGWELCVDGFGPFDPSNIPFLSQVCNSQEGEGNSTISIDEREIPFIGASDQIDYLYGDVQPDRFENLRQAINATTGDRTEDIGTNQKQQNRDDRIYRLSALANHKLNCYNQGIVVESQDLQKPFDTAPARCMNFANWNLPCTFPDSLLSPDEVVLKEEGVISVGRCKFPKEVNPADINQSEIFTEKSFWENRIPECLDLTNANNSNTSQLLTTCLEKIDELDWIEEKLLWSSTDIPVARRLIIGAVDELGATYEPITAVEATTQTCSQLALSAELNPNEVCGNLETTYYAYDVVTGDGARYATEQLQNFMLSSRALEELRTEPETSSFFEFVWNLILNAMDSIVQGVIDSYLFYHQEAPFWYERIPEQFRKAGAFDNADDARFVLIQRRFNILTRSGNEDQNKCLDVPEVSDTVPKKQNFLTKGSREEHNNHSLRVSEQHNGQLAKLTPTFDGLLNLTNPAPDEVPDDFRLEQYLNCEMYPNSLEIADENACVITRTQSSYAQGQQQVTQDACDAKLEFDEQILNTAQIEWDGDANCSCWDAQEPGGDPPCIPIEDVTEADLQNPEFNEWLCYEANSEEVPTTTETEGFSVDGVNPIAENEIINYIDNSGYLYEMTYNDLNNAVARDPLGVRPDITFLPPLGSNVLTTAIGYFQYLGTVYNTIYKMETTETTTETVYTCEIPPELQPPANASNFINSTPIVEQLPDETQCRVKKGSCFGSDYVDPAQYPDFSCEMPSVIGNGDKNPAEDFRPENVTTRFGLGETTTTPILNDEGLEIGVQTDTVHFIPGGSTGAALQKLMTEFTHSFVECPEWDNEEAYNTNLERCIYNNQSNP